MFKWQFQKFHRFFIGLTLLTIFFVFWPSIMNYFIFMSKNKPETFEIYLIEYFGKIHSVRSFLRTFGGELLMYHLSNFFYFTRCAIAWWLERGTPLTDFIFYEILVYYILMIYAWVIIVYSFVGQTSWKFKESYNKWYWKYPTIILIFLLLLNTITVFIAIYMTWKANQDD